MQYFKPSTPPPSFYDPPEEKEPVLTDCPSCGGAGWLDCDLFHGTGGRCSATGEVCKSGCFEGDAIENNPAEGPGHFICSQCMGQGKIAYDPKEDY